jgi:pilus assembly protein CpaF
MMAGYELPSRAIRQQISSALDVLVHLERIRDGSRRVTAISEVQRMEGDVIALQDVFTFRQREITSDGKVIGQLESTGLRPSFLDKFEKHGVALPTSLFAQPAATVAPFARGGRR